MVALRNRLGQHFSETSTVSCELDGDFRFIVHELLLRSNGRLRLPINVAAHLRHPGPEVLLGELEEAPSAVGGGLVGVPGAGHGAVGVGDVELLHRPADPAAQVGATPGRRICNNGKKMSHSQFALFNCLLAGVLLGIAIGKPGQLLLEGSWTTD